MTNKVHKIDGGLWKKDFYPIKYKESYKPDLHFLKIRSLVSLRKLQASKCTESWLVLTTTVETVSFFFKGLLKACCHGRFWSLATFKAKKHNTRSDHFPGSCALVNLYVHLYMLSAR